MNKDFLKFKNFFFIISLIFCFLSAFFLIKNGLKFGMEFTGGVEIELESKNPIDLNLFSKKFIDFSVFKIKYYGSKKSVQIRIGDISGDYDCLISILKNKLSDDVKIVKINYISAEINKENIKNSLNAAILSIIFMLVYLSYRFKYIMAFSALVTLIHDVILLLGIISFLNLEFNLMILSSIFTTFGYSVNDTIIVFDRIRENLNLNRDKNKYFIINLSINSTFSRTIVTSFSTLLVTIILMIFAGEHIFNFALIFFFGVVIGTYSSIYIASSLLFVSNVFFKSS